MISVLFSEALKAIPKINNSGNLKWSEILIFRTIVRTSEIIVVSQAQ
jgi:hypothetical protein